MGKKQRQEARERQQQAKAERQAEILAGPASTSSAEQFPPPSYAAQIWLTAEGLRLALPATLGERGHAVLLPLKPASMEVLVTILRERSRRGQQHRNERRIGTAAAPVQYDIEHLLRQFGSAGGQISRPPVVRTQLSDLGLDD